MRSQVIDLTVRKVDVSSYCTGMISYMSTCVCVCVCVCVRTKCLAPVIISAIYYKHILQAKYLQ